MQVPLLVMMPEHQSAWAGDDQRRPSKGTEDLISDF
jgi:hypothetical protein